MEKSWEEKGKIMKHQNSVELMATIYPKELGQWLLKKRIQEEVPKVLKARFIKDTNNKKPYLVPNYHKTKDEEDIKKDLIERIGCQLVTEILQSMFRGEEENYLKIRTLCFEYAEERRQVLLKGGCPIQLAALIEINHVSSPATIGVALPGPKDNGGHTDLYLMERLCWQIESFENIFLEKKCMPTPDFIHNYYPFLFSLYLWPGTGLLDKEEYFLMDTLSPDKENRQPFLWSEHEGTNRKKDYLTLEIRKKKDLRRRKAWEKRMILMGDPMMSLDDLDNLNHPFDPKKDSINFSLPYDSIRLWEIPVEELLGELPTGCLGLALFGHKFNGLKTKEIVQQAFWTLSLRIKEEGLTQNEIMKALFSLRSIAVNWLNPDTFYGMSNWKDILS